MITIAQYTKNTIREKLWYEQVKKLHPDKQMAINEALERAYIEGFIEGFIKGFIEGFIEGFMKGFKQESIKGFKQELIEEFKQGFIEFFKQELIEFSKKGEWDKRVIIRALLKTGTFSIEEITTITGESNELVLKVKNER